MFKFLIGSVFSNDVIFYQDLIRFDLDITHTCYDAVGWAAGRASSL